MPSISDADKAIAKAAAQAFGGRPRVARFWDDNHASSVDILTCEDRPQEGVISYSTVGLSGWPLFKGEKEYGARLEIVGACGSAFKGFDNALSTAAFCVINSKWFCCPGVIFPDVLAMYDCSPTMRHFLFVPPFLWEDHLNTLDLDGRKVAWLLAVPISEDERAFAEANGPEKLEELFADRQIDIFNLHRSSQV
ncbi:suppressor of fused domain protein [Botrimarina hoheduenensis]|uniref:Antitoxin YqcF n=1 Tax=Botrimarina hoheduenensis TaxID=2528000 RepID=A0A5C5WBJ1_9BACT|nr:suppressor of fused domain protein [Botrimarina hoheduenensis]TWT47583.1 Antitoxin YqcF [Botrimarina hoheduenensis]